MKPKRSRKTLNKQIASAPTLAAKINLALTGGNSASPIQELAFEAVKVSAILNDPNPPATHGPKWREFVLTKLRTKFTDVLFPALLKGDVTAFYNLIDAMSACKRTKDSPFASKSRTRSGRTEAGTKLRIALLTLEPEQRCSMKSILDVLTQRGLGDFDERHVRRVMREVGIGVFLPGQKVVWRVNGNFLRVILFKNRGTFVNTGLSKEGLADLQSKGIPIQWTELPAPPDK